MHSTYNTIIFIVLTCCSRSCSILISSQKHRDLWARHQSVHLTSLLINIDVCDLHNTQRRVIGIAITNDTAVTC